MTTHRPIQATLTDADLLTLRAELEALQGRLTQVLAALPKPPPTELPESDPIRLTATQYARRARMCLPHLRAYLQAGCPHRRQGKAILIDPAKADAWLDANHDHPTVKALVRITLDAARGRRAKG
jgi:hypothetical protein